jgi:hypothetical protein
MTNCVGPGITGRHRKKSAVPKIHKIMAITTEPIPTLTISELDHLTSSIGDDIINWSTTAGSSSTYGAVPNVTVNNNGLYSTITSAPKTFGPNVSGVTTMLGGTGYTYTTGTTSSPWLATGTDINPAMVVNQSGSIEIKGKDADIKINGKSMKTWMEAVEERLNILTPNPELEKDWDELQELGERYRALERKCKEKAQMWAALKKVQPQQP